VAGGHIGRQIEALTEQFQADEGLRTCKACTALYEMP